MKIGIIGAMDSEINLIKNFMTNPTEKTIGKVTFYEGKIFDKDIVLFKTGVGKVNAAIGCTIAIENFGIEKIIFTGIAGAINNKLNILDIVVSEKLVQHDFDLTGFGCPLGLIDGEDSIFFDADKTLVELSKNAAIKVLGDDKVYTGIISTGDQFIADKNKVQNIGSIFDAFAVEMEGGAVAQVASHFNIPFVVIRAMSDKADGSAHMNYEEFKPLASDHSAKIVLEILNNL